MRACLVVPCYNEEKRLNSAEFLKLVHADATVDLVFVDDGSKDETLAALRRIQQQATERVFIVEQSRNQGKAEAVRVGLLFALERGAQMVAYLDADLATPVSEALRLLERLRAVPDCQVLLASRVFLLGRNIVRTAPRHYAGRVFASVASLVLRLHVYDTQCGAKFFRNSSALREALSRPFLSRWAFDVELLSRLTSGPGAIKLDEIIEEPLLAWRDVTGSKLGALQMAEAGLDLARIAWSLRRQYRSN